MRERYGEIRATGADVVAIGTGDTRYAAAFVRDESIPFRVLVDDDGRAATVAELHSSSLIGLFHPRTWKATRATMRRGHRVHGAGRRVTQMGATFVIGPGPAIHYAHADRDSTDHAPMHAILAALHTSA